jgi:hypothetical protein
MSIDLNYTVSWIHPKIYHWIPTTSQILWIPNKIRTVWALRKTEAETKQARTLCQRPWEKHDKAEWGVDRKGQLYGHQTGQECFWGLEAQVLSSNPRCYLCFWDLKQVSRQGKASASSQWLLNKEQYRLSLYFTSPTLQMRKWGPHRFSIQLELMADDKLGSRTQVYVKVAVAGNWSNLLQMA